MTDAFIETTVLTDYLLKRDGSEQAAAAAFARHAAKIIPQFAWKEFKRGPLKNFVWTYNKLAESNSFTHTLAALQRMSRSPHRYITATAIQALHTAFSTFFDATTIGDLQKRYGGKANLDSIHADVLRLELKRAIFSAWGKRHTLFGGPQHLLKCYPDADIVDAKPRLEIEPRDCHRGVDCCLKAELSPRKQELADARSALQNEQPQRNETIQRSRVLRQIERHPNNLMGRKDCQRFGDVYFVFFCPDNAVIITTNVRDIQPMANALGVDVEAP